VLAISTIVVDNNGGVLVHKVLLFSIDPTENTGKKVLAIPSCYQLKVGTQDRQRWNISIAQRAKDRETEGRS
jgi:hypothetical protein